MYIEPDSHKTLLNHPYKEYNYNINIGFLEGGILYSVSSCYITIGSVILEKIPFESFTIVVGFNLLHLHSA